MDSKPDRRSERSAAAPGHLCPIHRIWKKIQFLNLFSIKEFKKTVPIHEYEDLKPYILRLMDGEENLLWNTPVRWFAKSSGTTSDKSKFIPVSEESLTDGHYKGAKDVLTMYYHFNPDSDLLTGKGLVIGGSHTVNQINENVQYGDLSAVLLQNSPFWGHWIRTPELSIALLDEWEDKIERLAQGTIHENVTSISGVPTWTLVLIKRILEITQKSTLSEVWPSLELYIHGGVSFTPYREQFHKLIGKDIHFLEMYNASEGFFAAQTHPQEDGMALFLTTAFSWNLCLWKNMENRHPNHWLAGCGTGPPICFGHQYEWRLMALPAWRHDQIHFFGALQDQGQRTPKTFYQCLWRRSNR